VYTAIGSNLAAYVNRSAIHKRTPEARLSGRLFDYDEVVSQFIGSKSEAFYLQMKSFWDWNSRYWEQFALLKLDKFIQSNRADRLDQLAQAISHAKHAIQLERHPLGLTTLGRIVFEEMRQVPDRFQTAFDEAFGYLNEAMNLEGRMNRIAIHPYTTMFSGTNHYLKQSGALSSKQLELLQSHMDAAEALFSYDHGLLNLTKELRQRVKKKT
jgi:hypothetical protein